MRRGALAWPYLLGLALLVAAPAVVALALSFTDYTGVAAPTFQGFDNFIRLVGDEGFWRALANSAFYILIAVPLRLVAAVAFALLLHRRARGIGAARAIAYLPTVIPDVAYALLWLWLLNPLYGPLSAGLVALGVDPPGWLNEPWAARITVPVLSAFQVGEAFVIALAARSLIPSSLYEAAEVDGAQPWFVLRRITLPIMAPVLVLLAIRDLIFSLQVNFVPALLLTDGGPRLVTTYLPLYVYREAFRYFRLGYASTIALTMFVIMAVLIFVQYRLARRWRFV